MKTIQVYDPALCCNTGVCGADVDQALVSFSADVDWAKQAGVQIERFNLAQQPLAFAENPVVKSALETTGEAALPLVLGDGEMLLSGRYPTRKELGAWLGVAPSPAAEPQPKTSGCCGSSAGPAASSAASTPAPAAAKGCC
ncbi:MAG: arsenical resistance operon transcriptional repressor ArsD [Leptolyngbya sp. DLM2.Bin27]|nr:MAG: arsenical resistance operon transcriptional repressor ArsD [Leptolyngbya sp. DLM2.Bin27]